LPRVPSCARGPCSEEQDHVSFPPFIHRRACRRCGRCRASAQTTTSAQQDPKKLDCTSKAGQNPKPKVVFQVNRVEDAPLILRFVTNYLKSEPESEVMVVGYASGIDFMLKNANDSEGKPYATQVNRLLDMGVNFKVCNNTLKARNATPDIVLANVGVVPSAVNEIVRLQTQEGYSYFRH
jgi:intracellular sulfur oxidation DsrE/DsrF family protein